MDGNTGRGSGSRSRPRAAYTVAEVAEDLGVSADTVRELVRCNKLPHKRLGRRIVIPVVLFQRWLAEGDAWASAEGDASDV